MSELNNYIGSWYYAYIPTLSFIHRLLSNCRDELFYLLLPEDTTEGIVGRQSESTGYTSNNTRAMIKGVFWTIGSIVISLAIGQLN